MTEKELSDFKKPTLEKYEAEGWPLLTVETVVVWLCFANVSYRQRLPLDFTTVGRWYNCVEPSKIPLSKKMQQVWRKSLAFLKAWCFVMLCCVLDVNRWFQEMRLSVVRLSKDPRDTRHVLGRCLRVCSRSPGYGSTGAYGVFRM